MNVASRRPYHRVLRVMDRNEFGRRLLRPWIYLFPVVVLLSFAGDRVVLTITWTVFVVPLIVGFAIAYGWNLWDDWQRETPSEAATIDGKKNARRPLLADAVLLVGGFGSVVWLVVYLLTSSFGGVARQPSGVLLLAGFVAVMLLAERALRRGGL